MPIALGAPSLPVGTTENVAACGFRARFPGYRRAFAVVRAHGPPYSAELPCGGRPSFGPGK